MAGLHCAERNGAKRPWLVQLLGRRRNEVAAVALADENARMNRATTATGERYHEPLVA